MADPPKYNIDPKRQIFYIKKADMDYKNAKVVVRISKNFKVVVLAYGKDSY